MNSFWSQIVSELFSNIVGSFIFLFIVLYCMRPSIVISSVIAKQENSFDEETPYTFVFKMINRSRFDAYEIQIELYEVTFFPAVPVGINRRLTEIPLKQSHIKQIPARKRLTRNSFFASHCVTFRTNTDLCSLLTNQSKAILLQITLKHGLSGLSRIFKADYRGCSCIIPGNFCFGNSLDVK